jgi:sulfur carrier protein
MIIYVNGEACQLENEIELKDLLAELSLPLDRIAVELNQAVVPRKEWPQTIIKDADRLEVVHFVGGGKQ